MTPEVQKVFHQKAKELDCPTYELDKEFSIRENDKNFDFHYQYMTISNITFINVRSSSTN